MVLKLLRVTIVVAVMLSAWGLLPQASDQGQAWGRERTAPNMFYNFYAPPVWSDGVGAQLYVSPRPTPPLVGHTYITYQPLMPNEFLYRHNRTYYHQHPGGKTTRTIVRWR